MKKENFRIGTIPAVLYGDPAEQVFLFVHGQCGCKEEAEAFARVAVPAGWQVLGIDLPGHGERQAESDHFFPWYAVPELRLVADRIRQRWPRWAVRANSIGAWFCMQAFSECRPEEQPPENCLFVSPLIDMEQLIGGMMQAAGVTEERLRAEGEIPTAFGQTLSWRYLSYAREHLLHRWAIPTALLYGERDSMTPLPAAQAFAALHGCPLTVMPEGEHWFHTTEQLAFLENWERAQLT